jgi:PAS domain S-box-containing protein
MTPREHSDEPVLGVENVNERRYRMLTEVVTSIVWGAAASGEVVSELPSWSSFTGQTDEEVRGWGWLSAIHPDDWGPTASDWSAAVATKSVFRSENRVRRKDGEYRHMLARAIPILDEEGAIIEWVGAHIDITEQKLSQAALAESERFARCVLDSLSAHIAILDEGGTILAVNKIWREFALGNSANGEVGVGANYRYRVRPLRRRGGSRRSRHPCRPYRRSRGFLARVPLQLAYGKAMVRSPGHALLWERADPRGHLP